ncbi:MAG: hypothetical protein ACRDKE_11890 [Solirubrobacterales bacterium]
MRRILPLTLAFFILFSVPVAGAATKLTNKNSVSFPFATSGFVEGSGVGCGSSASVTFAAQLGAYNLKVTEPTLGPVEPGNNVRVASITVDKNVVTIGLIADGAEICTPSDPETPPATIPWRANFKVFAEYDRRVQVPVRNDLTLGPGTKWKIKPSTIWNGKGSLGEKLYGLKWNRFGSKKAVGKGRLLQLYCKRGDNCPDNRKRAKITLSNPGYCQSSGQLEYRHMKIVVRGRLQTEVGNEKKNGGSLCNY